MLQVTYGKVGFHNCKILKSNYNPHQEGSNGNQDDKRNKVATEFVCKLLDRSLEFRIIIIMSVFKSFFKYRIYLVVSIDRNILIKLHMNATRSKENTHQDS